MDIDSAAVVVVSLNGAVRVIDISASFANVLRSILRTGLDRRRLDVVSL
jgi:hypothetical protein